MGSMDIQAQVLDVSPAETDVTYRNGVPHRVV
jgi:hypothetical protein